MCKEGVGQLAHESKERKELSHSWSERGWHHCQVSVNPVCDVGVGLVIGAGIQRWCCHCGLLPCCHWCRQQVLVTWWQCHTVIVVVGGGRLVVVTWHHCHVIVVVSSGWWHCVGVVAPWVGSWTTTLSEERTYKFKMKPLVNKRK